MAGKGPYVEAEKLAMNEIWEKWNPEVEPILSLVSRSIEQLPGRQPSNVVKYLEALHGKTKEITVDDERSRVRVEEDHLAEQILRSAGVDPNPVRQVSESAQTSETQTNEAQNGNNTSVGESMALGTLPQRREPLDPPKPRAVEAETVIPVVAGVTLDRREEGPTVITVKATIDGEQAAELLYTAISDLRKVREQLAVLQEQEAKLVQTVREALQTVKESVGV